ncbi:DUF262 domain-containing protein [Scytonema sp. PRP1]|uniref:DUF262 domain-containing protein n=1 Tax=Scytonema sp. PRP1 TaxID=3120513 RepID=UPI002FCFB8B4
MSDYFDLPLVKDATRSQSESIQTIVNRLENREVYIPDYQRDCDQWDDRKKSLFIESLLNNLTIPAFFFCEDDNGDSEVIDGQQRLTTILQFSKNELKISDDDSIDYLLPQAIQYRGKNYNELPNDLRKIFNKYPLTIIFLPKSMPLGVKLEVFRRINEGGTPLTGQDIRLAYYSQSKSVFFIRLAGIHCDSESAKRMINSAQERGITNPWDSNRQAKTEWYNWWGGKEKAKGQTPSLMFLWYLICLERNKFNDILNTSGGTNHLGIVFRGTTEEALDIYCAQLQYQDSEASSPPLVSSLDEISNHYFPEFAEWIYRILSRGLPGISVDTYKQLALFIAGAVELQVSPDSLSNSQWNSLGNFIRRPRQLGRDILGNNDAYPEPKGRWTGQRGQKMQCNKAVEIAGIILQNNV